MIKTLHFLLENSKNIFWEGAQPHIPDPSPIARPTHWASLDPVAPNSHCAVD